MSVGAVAVAGLVAASVWLGGSARPDVLLSAGTAWLASAQGLVTLLDGPSEQVIGNVRTQGADGATAVVQAGTSALVVDNADGSVTRVDGATYDVTEPVTLGSGPLDVLSGGGETVVVDRDGGRALVVDPEDLSVRREVPLGAGPGPGQSVVDSDGTLWVVDGDRGGVSLFRDGSDPVRAPVGDEMSQLVVVEGRAVLVDLNRGQAGWLDDDGAVSRWSCMDLPPGSGARLLGAAGAPRVYAAVPGIGELIVAELEQDECARPIDLGPTGTELGPLVQAGGFVMVPDLGSGQAVIVDPDAGEVAARPDVVPAGTAFELLAKDGLVFYNEVQGELAGLLHVEGGVWTAGPGVRKYSSAPSEVPVLAGADTAIAPEDLPPPPVDTPVQPTTGPSTPASPGERTTGPATPGGPTAPASPAPGTPSASTSAAPTRTPTTATTPPSTTAQPTTTAPPTTEPTTTERTTTEPTTGSAPRPPTTSAPPPPTTSAPPPPTTSTPRPTTEAPDSTIPEPSIETPCCPTEDPSGGG